MATGVFNNNNAPLPIPGGYGNPTGALNQPKNIAGAPTGGGAFPQMSAFVPPTTPGANVGSNPSTDFGGMSSGFGGNLTPELGGNMFRELERAYGKGTAALLMPMLTKGLFNPQVAQAFMNSMQPSIARGQADILGAFGAGGNRFSSSAALGLGDYMSQVNLNQEQTLAQMFQHSQDQELSLLSQLFPTLHQEQANADKGGIFSKILGIAAPFASLIPGVGPLLGAGLKGISGALGGGGGQGGGGQQGFGDMASILKQMMSPTQSGLSPSEISARFGGPSEVPTITQSLPDILSMDAGNIWSNNNSGVGSFGDGF